MPKLVCRGAAPHGPVASPTPQMPMPVTCLRLLGESVLPTRNTSLPLHTTTFLRNHTRTHTYAHSRPSSTIPSDFPLLESVPMSGSPQSVTTSPLAHTMYVRESIPCAWAHRHSLQSQIDCRPPTLYLDCFATGSALPLSSKEIMELQQTDQVPHPIRHTRKHAGHEKACAVYDEMATTGERPQPHAHTHSRHRKAIPYLLFEHVHTHASRLRSTKSTRMHGYQTHRENTCAN